MCIRDRTGTCTGIVKDATGEGVIGASVVVKGTTNGTITGLDGDFSLSKMCIRDSSNCHPTPTKVHRFHYVPE